MYSLEGLSREAKARLVCACDLQYQVKMAFLRHHMKITFLRCHVKLAFVHLELGIHGMLSSHVIHEPAYQPSRICQEQFLSKALQKSLSFNNASAQLPPKLLTTKPQVPQERQ